MSSRPAPQELLPWALSELQVPDGAAPALSVVAGDASPRRYFRLAFAARSYILVEAPPATEKNAEFVSIAGQLHGADVRVPAVLAVDYARGFLLLEDLGDRLLLPLLNSDFVDAYYRQAFGVLKRMAGADPTNAGLGAYDRTLLGEELSRFQQWFVQQLLGYTPTSAEQVVLDDLVALLIDRALQQPRVLVHRDFHSRNLMLTDTGELAVIDFQDAVVGPITYDVVSLLRDCYIRWPAAQVEAWALAYRELLLVSGHHAGDSAQQFLAWFDWMGLQRHLKVLGTFARLYLRDGKPGYLDDLPLVIEYVLEITAKYASEEPVFAAFHMWFTEQLSPLIAKQAWSKPQ